MTRSDSGVQVSLPGLVPFPNFGHGPNHYSVIYLVINLSSCDGKRKEETEILPLLQQWEVQNHFGQ